MTGATGWLAVLPLPAGEDEPLAAVGTDADDLEPAIAVRDVEEAAVRHGPRAGGPLRAAAGDPVLRAGRGIHEMDLRDVVIRAAGRRDCNRLPVGRPGEVLDVNPARSEGPRLRWLWHTRRPAPTRHRSIDEPDLRPAAPPRQERQLLAVRRPAGHGDARRMARDDLVARTVRLDQPEGVVAHVGEPSPVRRPLRIRNVLLRGRQLDREDAAEREAEELPGTGRLGGVCDGPVTRMKPELPRRFDGHDLLDRQAARRSSGRGGTVGGRGHRQSPSGQPIRATNGAIMARCARTWPCRSSYAQLKPSGSSHSASVIARMAASRRARPAT